MKNVRSFICNTVTLLVSVLFLIFMGQAHVGYVAKEVLGVSAGSTWHTGYDYLSFSIDDGKTIALGVGLLIATILACVLILTAIYGILRSFNVVKANKADKIVRYANLGVIVVFMVSMFLAFIMGICIVAEHNADEVKSLAFTAEYGWALATNFVLAILSTVAVCMDKAPKKVKQTKKSK